MVGLGLIAFVRWLGSAHGLIAALSKLAAAALAVALLIGLPKSGTAVTTPRASSETISEPWPAARVAELRGEGRTIFADFTADWCLSCKVNERRSEEHTSELQSLMRISYAVFCLKK